MKINELTGQKIASCVFLMRSQKVMMDVDLATLYGVETKYLKRQVNRNSERFPPDFLYRINKNEVAPQVGVVRDTPLMHLRNMGF
jgi:hypothetical protein